MCTHPNDNYSLLHPMTKQVGKHLNLKIEKVQEGKDQENVQSEKIPTPKTEMGKINNQVLIP